MLNEVQEHIFHMQIGIKNKDKKKKIIGSYTSNKDEEKIIGSYTSIDASDIMSATYWTSRV